jgi:hypothetical protein
MRSIASRMSSSRSRSLLKRNRLGEHPLADPGLQAWFCDHIDWMTKQVLEVYEQRGQVEQAPARLEVDQEIDVAGGVGIPRATDPKTRTLPAPWRAAPARICSRTWARSSIDGRSAMPLLLSSPQ